MNLRNMLLGLLLGLTACVSAAAQEVYPLGDQRELFCDETMIASMSDCQILVHQPVPQAKGHLAPLMRPTKFPEIPVSLERNTEVFRHPLL